MDRAKTYLIYIHKAFPAILSGLSIELWGLFDRAWVIGAIRVANGHAVIWLRAWVHHHRNRIRLFGLIFQAPPMLQQVFFDRAAVEKSCDLPFHSSQGISDKPLRPFHTASRSFSWGLDHRGHTSCRCPCSPRAHQGMDSLCFSSQQSLPFLFPIAHYYGDVTSTIWTGRRNTSPARSIIFSFTFLVPLSSFHLSSWC